jgi:hypothetical protein
MFLPPTMLPNDLRVLVDPPIQFPEAFETPPLVVSSSLWSRLRSTLSGTRPARTTMRPCEDEAHSAPRSLLGRPNPCTD